MSFIQNKAKKIISKKRCDGNVFCRDSSYMNKKSWNNPTLRFKRVFELCEFELKEFWCESLIGTDGANDLFDQDDFSSYKSSKYVSSTAYFLKDIEKKLSSFLNISCGTPQGTILGPLVTNIWQQNNPSKEIDFIFINWRFVTYLTYLIAKFKIWNGGHKGKL